MNRRGGCPALKFSPECEVAHTSPRKLFRRLTQIRARRRGDDGRWPPKTNLSCVKSAKKGMLPGARKNWHFGNGATKDTSTAASGSSWAPAAIAAQNPSVRDRRRSWMKLFNESTTSCSEHGPAERQFVLRSPMTRAAKRRRVEPAQARSANHLTRAGGATAASVWPLALSALATKPEAFISSMNSRR